MDSTGDDLGPQNDTDGPFEARMRLHQRWYRTDVLGLEQQTGPAAGDAGPVGGMLARDEAAAGHNFLDPAIFAAVRSRLRMGSGVDALRCLADMLSSDALSFNLWAPLVEDTELATRLLQTLLPDVERVVEVHIAYAPSPRSEYLGDRTRFDAFVGYLRPGGARAFVGVVTRLAGAGAEAAPPTERSKELASAEDSPWRDGADDELAGSPASDLWRTHLLVEALRRHRAEPYEHGLCAVVRHPADERAAAAVEQYRSRLRDPGATLADWRLDDLVGRWEQAAVTAQQRQWLAALRLRYLDLERSDAARAGAAPVAGAVGSAADR